MRYDVIVVGAGAAGLMAATRAAERGRSVLLLEKNRRAGVKILASGGTRCNLTHDCDARGIVQAYGEQGDFLHSALAALGPRELVEWIEAEGVPTKVEPNGKVFPVSDRAADVLHALVKRLSRSGCELATDEPLLDCGRTEAGDFELKTGKRTLHAAKLVITTGGKSYAKCGTTGDGYDWARRFGHTIVPPRPALTPITTDAPWVLELSGMTLPDVVVRVEDPTVATAASGERGRSKSKGRSCERRGGLLFTHFGFSGPAALDVSRFVSGHPDPRSLFLVCDFVPQTTVAGLEQAIQQASAEAGRRQLAAVLPESIPARLAESLVKLAGVPAARRVAELSRAERAAIVKVVKSCRIPVSGTLGFAKAEVTAGGVSLAEVDSHTMESRLAPGLYFAGEVLDLDGPIGGFNFQAAFSTGVLAGQCV